MYSVRLKRIPSMDNPNDLDPPFIVGAGHVFQSIDFVSGGIWLKQTSSQMFIPYDRVWEIEFRGD